MSDHRTNELEETLGFVCHKLNVLKRGGFPSAEAAIHALRTGGDVDAAARRVVAATAHLSGVPGIQELRALVGEPA